MEPILKIENLNYIYSAGTPFEHKALDYVNFTVNCGEFIGIIGHTGSGKSTLMQHLNGLLKPTSGRVILDGKDIWSDKALTRQARFRVGLVFQYPEYQLFEETVYKDIAFGPRNMGLSEEEIDRRVREAAGFVGLTDAQLEVSPFDLSGGQKRRVAIAGVIAMEPEVLILDEPTAGLDPSGREEIDRRVREAAGFVGLTDEQLLSSPFDLSGGQKRRVAIAGVIAMEPEVLILDEPTAGLDPAGRAEILGNIESYRKAKNATIMMVSHSMEDVARLTDRLMVMNGSQLTMDGTPGEVFTQAERLVEMGLNIPQVTQVFLRLRKMGLPVENVYTLEQAVEALKALKGGCAHA